MKNHTSTTPGDRLREERERIGLSQGLLAQHGGVKKLTQGSYENGKSFPNVDYLARVAAFGIDVLYVVTGEHKPVRQHVIAVVQHDDEEVSGRPVISLDERAQAMVQNYTATSDEGRRTIEKVALFAAESAAKPKKHATGGQ